MLTLPTLWRTLLAAAVLLQGLGVPVVRHSHEGGTRKHTHQDDRATHRHEDGSCHCHADGRHAEDWTLLADEPHAHVMLFGLELHWPMPAEPTSEPTSELLTLGRLGDETVASVVGQQANVPALLAELSTTPDSAVDLALSPGHLLAPVQSHPLCDIARRARTGVLRI